MQNCGVVVTHKGWCNVNWPARARFCNCAPLVVASGKVVAEKLGHRKRYVGNLIENPVCNKLQS